MADLTSNDFRVLRNVKWAMGEWDGLIPHGIADQTGIRRLVACGLIKDAGYGLCIDCPEWKHHEGSIYALTDAGRKALEARPVEVGR